MSEQLPAWRLALAIAILGGMAVVLLSLAPVYLKDRQFRNYLRDLARRPGLVTIPDTILRDDIVTKARGMGLPVSAPEVGIARKGGKVSLDVRYTVSFDSYQVDLHFHEGASSR